MAAVRKEDILMGKGLDKANENITILAEELIDARQSALGSGNCIYWNENNRPCNKYIVKNKKE